MCLMPNENLENSNFESLLDATEDILLDNSCDPDSEIQYSNKILWYIICNTREISWSVWKPYIWWSFISPH